MMPLEQRETKAAKQRARYHAAHPLARRYVRDASDRDELGPKLVAVKQPLRPCVGCGRATVRGLHYCRRCKARLRAGLPVDLDELPTVRELVSAGLISGGGR